MPEIVLVHHPQIFFDPILEAGGGLLHIRAGEQQNNVWMWSKSATNPVMEDGVVLHGVACAEVDHAILAFGQMPLDGVHLEGLAVIEGGFERSAFGKTPRMVLVEADLAEICPAIFVERVARQAEARREKAGDGAFSDLHGANQYDDHGAAEGETSQMRFENSMMAPDDTNAKQVAANGLVSEFCAGRAEFAESALCFLA